VVEALTLFASLLSAHVWVFHLYFLFLPLFAVASWTQAQFPGVYTWILFKPHGDELFSLRLSQLFFS
jgi:hypothetical protein